MERAKAKRTNIILSREHVGHRKYPLPTTQQVTVPMEIIRWSILKSD